MSTQRPKVLLTRGDYPEEGVRILKERCDLDIWPEKAAIPRSELLKRVKGVNGIYISLTDKIDQELIDAAGKDLKAVATISVGVDHIDFEATQKAGIRVGYTPNVLTEATAELTVAILLATSRRLFEASKELRIGGWKSWAPLWMCGPGLSGSTVGIFGMGRIGLSVARKLLAFDAARILYTGRSKKKEGDEIGAQFVDLDTLLKESDFVVVTCALTPETTNVFTAEKFALMKPTAIFVNTARGAVVDQDALVDALKNKVIAAAGLDVMTPEPLPVDHPLTKLDNCVLIPHIGSGTNESRRDMSILTANNILAALDGKPMPAEMKK